MITIDEIIQGKSELRGSPAMRTFSVYLSAVHLSMAGFLIQAR